MENVDPQKYRFFFLGMFLFFWGTLGFCQNAMRNVGNLKLLENAEMGFHVNLVNDGVFDENLGLVGFFNEEFLTISGAFRPIFNDMEVMAANDLILEVGVGVTNNLNLILGDVMTPRTLLDVNLDFIDQAFHTGQSNTTKIDGYAALTNQKNFNFPVGYGNQLKPLLLLSDEVNTKAKCAYFYEDPNNPSTFAQPFDTGQKAMDLGDIGTSEFWRLEGSVSSTVQISWNEASNMAAITDDASIILLVGWSKAADQWVSLGSSESVGDLSAGFATSMTFIPNDYEIITFGTARQPLEALDLGNYLVTPNGDGINDTFVLEELKRSPNNMVQIYDRFGLKVFEKDNYTNEFNGFATTGNVIFGRNEGLPSGVYFYIAKLHDLDLEFQGFLYLAPRP